MSQRITRRSRCRACGFPGTPDNPLKDFEHDQSCLIYEPSGACTCTRSGYIAHAYRCPVPVEGDMAPPRPVENPVAEWYDRHKDRVFTVADLMTLMDYMGVSSGAVRETIDFLDRAKERGEPWNWTPPPK